ncbi:OmpA family protein [Dyadobacter tibetensis]|uniref:OmpA family protein n=1 Tax=Dyadobacter tibetensis TaxID=1211851 RepID=UPI00046E56E4|nr:OmpA family protein [Dyadobacter tibetensis]
MKFSFFKYTIFPILSLLATAYAQGQNTQWAQTILGYSSELRDGSYGEGYRAVQVLGQPNKLPSYGDSPVAWTSARPDGADEEWIKVGFKVPIRLAQVFIGENHHPGAVTRVYAYDTEGREYLIDKREPGPVAGGGRELRIFPSESDIVCKAIKVVLAPSTVTGFNQLDAIGISDSTDPIRANIRITQDLESLQKKENLGAAVNSKGTELAPVISSDGKTLYFARANHPGNIGTSQRQDIWQSTLDNRGRWSNATNLGAPLNNYGDNAITSISADGNKIYLINKYLPDGTLEFGFSYSMRSAGGWSFPQELRIPSLGVNQNNNSMEVTVSPLGNVLLMALERPDTEGKRDIYVSFLSDENQWTPPLNIGSTINSAANESSPFLALDNKTLYFSSEGHSGFGQSDLFLSRRLDDSWTKWSEPENLGPAINSEGWEGYFNLPADATFAYFSSTAENFSDVDIYRIRLSPEIKPQPLVHVSGTVYDLSNNQPISAEIIVSNSVKDSTILKTTFIPTQEKFQLFLPQNTSYRIEIRKEGYFPEIKELVVNQESTIYQISLDAYLRPIVKGENIRLSNTMFAQSSATISPGTYEELDLVADYLIQNPQSRVLLEGHTDNQGDIKKNVQLAQDRVNAVKKYLTGKGVAPGRIDTKAWGPSRPLTHNLTEEARQKNRRVEFTILDR